ncbi:unnamed protein product [Parascedosporium putredinis]|uniref:Fumarylacetoacetase n=1 Tax=Parascedosporium putredinis TaxID=1442378 RepID=A0A9P1MCA5_9PEZI|nr:unnamed protein product [Parascedosporium putredinis]CAI8000270.1 unnamed protein product [Parascedosporium putredinis]
MLKDSPTVFHEPTLNSFAALGRQIHSQVRSALQDLLSSETQNPAALRDDPDLRNAALLHRSTVHNHLPVSIGDYTDFYAGYNHAFMVGCLFRGPANALQPNYTHLPVAYHSRSSSVIVSNTPVYRPIGQILLDPSAEQKEPTTAAARRLDMELELGVIMATGNELGSRIKIDDAESHIFGYVLLNDWSARDIQAWEYVPLGPFNAKNFASTISPWIVLADALEPFMAKGIENKTVIQNYLKESRAENVVDLELEVELTTSEGHSTMIAKTTSRNLLWSFPQMIAHHTLGGCPLRTGDLLGSGTISGTEANQKGSLLELSGGGKSEIT